jgi:LacI family transcriptional regulator
MKKKITIDDIAKKLEVSKTAVSFALNGKAREKLISTELENKILAYVEEVGYKPNHSAQSLRTGKTKLIALMVEDISDPFFSTIARLMEEDAYKKGYKIFYRSTENSLQKTRELIDIFRSMQVDGYIIAPPVGIETELENLIKEGYAVVLFDRTLPGIELNSVTVNNFQGSYMAVRHLIASGYQNIAMITLSSEQIQMADRQRGYKQAIDEINKPYLIKNVIYHDQKENCIAEMIKFFRSHREIDAVFFTTNYIADNGLEAIRNLKLHIPQDIGVVVFDDYNFYRLHSPPVTAVAQPIKEISDQVINMILKLLLSNENKKTVVNVVLSTELVIRQSALLKTTSVLP